MYEILFSMRGKINVNEIKEINTKYWHKNAATEIIKIEITILKEILEIFI